MKTSIVLTIIANDQPGIIQRVSDALYQHQGSWSQSSMSSLAGQFAGILLASVPADQTSACIAQLKALESDGIRIIVRVGEEVSATQETHEYSLDLVGNNRAGIVHDITTILSKHDVNVRKLKTRVESASMGGAKLFKASAKLVVPLSADIDVLIGELEDMANELMVDIQFEK